MNISLFKNIIQTGKKLPKQLEENIKNLPDTQVVFNVFKEDMVNGAAGLAHQGVNALHNPFLADAGHHVVNAMTQIFRVIV